MGFVVYFPAKKTSRVGSSTSIPKKTYSFVIFQGGVRTSIPKKTYIFVIFQGGVHTSITRNLKLCDFPGWGRSVLHKTYSFLILQGAGP